MCRKWGGSPLLAVECGSNVDFEGKEHISTFDSSDWAERGICQKFGFRVMSKSSAEVDTTDLLPSIDVPTLVLCGDDDRSSLPALQHRSTLQMMGVGKLVECRQRRNLVCCGDGL